MSDKELEKNWDFVPQHALLDPLNDRSEPELSFGASFGAHGMYETMRFVLRLSPRNHELVDSITSEGAATAEISAEALQAYSTYIHETVHWWQHVGSTSGLLLSLSYLGQTHASLKELRDVIAQFGLKKPLKRWTDEVLLQEGPAAQEKLASANVAVNNTLDIEYYKAYAHSPRKNAQFLVDQQHFECIGHGYHIAYGQLLGMLSDAFDPNFELLPDARKWDDEFRRLKNEKVEGFYWRSPIHVPPVGLHAIYEGQARFIQLQFLNKARNNSPTCQEWREMGYLSGIYVEAFESFLKLSQTSWPQDLDDPIVGLFLLICDLAINPTRGFPLQIESFDDFILDVDVGVRFARLSLAVVELPDLRTSITECSRDEYIDVSDQLTRITGYDHPLAALEKIIEWPEQSPKLAELMAEHKTFNFNLKNLPIRVFFSHFMSFVRDKYSNPEVFCWAGAWMVGSDVDENIKALWLRNLSLFSDRGDKAGVYPRKWPDRDEAAIQKTFESFYGTMSLYDVTRQWILNEGPFKLDYSWLSANYSQEHADAWAEDTFSQVYGASLKDFQILKKPSGSAG